MNYNAPLKPIPADSICSLDESGCGALKRRMVASRDIEPGERILCETALFSVSNVTVTDTSGQDPSGNMSHHEVWSCPISIQDQKHRFGNEMSPSLFLKMHEHIIKTSPELLTTKAGWLTHFCINPVKTNPEVSKACIQVMRKCLAANMSEFDAKTYLAHSIRFWMVYQANHFRVLLGPADIATGVALYQWASYFNHCCDPNASFYFGKQSKIEIFARRRIPRGHEISISYITRTPNLIANLPENPEVMGFKCMCGKCPTDGFVHKGEIQGDNVDDFIYTYKHLVKIIGDHAKAAASGFFFKRMLEMKKEFDSCICLHDRQALPLSEMGMLVLSRECVLVADRTASLLTGQELFERFQHAAKVGLESGSLSEKVARVLFMRAQMCMAISSGLMWSIMNKMQKEEEMDNEDLACKISSMNNFRESSREAVRLLNEVHFSGKQREKAKEMLEYALLMADVQAELWVPIVQEDKEEVSVASWV
ncbi:MAG: SET domain-containing methyltransferase [Planctomycetota bacterium]